MVNGKLMGHPSTLVLRFTIHHSLFTIHAFGIWLRQITYNPAPCSTDSGNDHADLDTCGDVCRRRAVGSCRRGVRAQRARVVGAGPRQLRGGRAPRRCVPGDSAPRLRHSRQHRAGRGRHTRRHPGAVRTGKAGAVAPLPPRGVRGARPSGRTAARPRPQRHDDHHRRHLPQFRGRRPDRHRVPRQS